MITTTAHHHHHSHLIHFDLQRTNNHKPSLSHHSSRVFLIFFFKFFCPRKIDGSELLDLVLDGRKEAMDRDFLQGTPVDEACLGKIKFSLCNLILCIYIDRLRSERCCCRS